MSESERQHSDPLLPQAGERLQELWNSAGFPSGVLAGLMFVVAFLFGGSPEVDDGPDAPREQTQQDGIDSSSSSTTPEEAGITTTTVELVSLEQLDESIVAAGFPAVEALVDGSTVIVVGTVPDQASAEVVLQRVGAVEGVTEVINQLEIEAAAGASAASIDLDRSTAVITGVVGSEEEVDRLIGLVGQFYREDQIDTDQVIVDEDAAPLASVTVTGSLSDGDLIEQIEQTYQSLSSLQVLVDLEQTEQPRVELLLDELLAANPIEFQLGQASITPAAAATLDEVAEILGQFPNASVEVGGHTDSQGGDALNQQLSQDRATTVIDELRARGVEIDLVAVGYGSLRPRVSPEQTPADQAANRRIEFRLQ